MPKSPANYLPGYYLVVKFKLRKRNCGCRQLYCFFGEEHCLWYLLLLRKESYWKVPQQKKHVELHRLTV